MKQPRHEKVARRKAKAMAAHGGETPRMRPLVAEQFKRARGATWCASQILETGRRIDGRDHATVRPIVAEVGILPRVHGSALFTRGETQALVRGHAGHRPGRAR